MAIPRFYTFDEIAKATHAPRPTVEHWAYRGLLKTLKVGRRRLVTEAELHRFLHLADGGPEPTEPTR
jgi:excisionase family DNA binding protein